MRQHQVTGAIIILAVHPGDGHKVRELPEEEHRVECPGLEGQLPDSRRVQNATEEEAVWQVSKPAED